MGERAQTRLSSKCPELGDLLLKLKAEGVGRFGVQLDNWVNWLCKLLGPFFEGLA